MICAAAATNLRPPFESAGAEWFRRSAADVAGLKRGAIRPARGGGRAYAV